MISLKLHLHTYTVYFITVWYVESAWDSGCILVHCKVGVSRSTTFAVAFLMFKYQVHKYMYVNITTWGGNNY